MNLKFDEKLPIKLAVSTINNVVVTEDDTAFEKLQACTQNYFAENSGKEIGQIKGVQIARDFFRAIGVDPTKRRPSSEALLRRAVKNKPLYTVNTLVDIGNWCSLDFLLPICVYDADKTGRSIEIRRGKQDEFYEGINRQPVHLDGRYVLADEQGPFGSPITDSVRTSVDLGTNKVYLIIFAPDYYDQELLSSQATLFNNRVLEICGGSIESQIIVPEPVI